MNVGGRILSTMYTKIYTRLLHLVTFRTSAFREKDN